MAIVSRSRPGAALAAILLLVGVPAAGQPAPGLIDAPGEYHGDELPAANGETWLALVPGDPVDLLQPVTVTVDAVPDLILGEPENGAVTGKRLSLPRLPAFPRFLVRDLPGVVPGAVETVIGETLPLTDALPLETALRGRGQETLRLDCAPDRDPDSSTGYRCRLLLSRGGASQELAAFAATPGGQGQPPMLGDDAMPAVRWAGDLDHDGALDWLIDLSAHYNVDAPTLFLSGAAGRGELVRAVADHTTTGC